MTRYPRSNTQDTLLGIKSGNYLTALGKICGTKDLKRYLPIVKLLDA